MLRVQGLRGNVLSRLGQAAEGVAALRGALDQALAGSLPDTAAELQQRLADALEHSGDYQAAAAAYAAAYQFCDAHGADAVGQLCRACATVVLFTRGEWDRTVSVCQDVLAPAAAPHARAVGAGLLGLVHALRGAPRLARPHLLDSNLTATRIELTAMELISAWGLCILDDAAGAHDSAADRARQVLTRLSRTQERHYSVPILQWLATFFAEQGLPTDTSACAAALAQIAEATAQPEAIAALAHARGETLLADEPEAAALELHRAAGMFSHLDLPLQAAQAQRRAATAATRLGEHARARELLHAAYATADQLGARQLRESCAAELGQLGDKPRRRRASRGAGPPVSPAANWTSCGWWPRATRAGRSAAPCSSARARSRCTCTAACRSCSAGPGPKRCAGSPSWTLCASPAPHRPDRDNAVSHAAGSARRRAGNRRAVWPVEASYASTMLAGMRPRSLSSMPCCLAQARMSRLR